MHTSRRAARLAESATMRVNRLASELTAAGRRVVDFSAGQPDFESPAVAVDAARAALAAGRTRYTAAAGTPELRRALAERFARDFGAPWAAADVVVSSGAKTALYELFQVLVDEGDEVVMPSPAWVSFEEQVQLAGGTVRTVPTAVEDGFAIHAEPLLEALGDRTRVVLINSPGNPTGGVISAPALRQLTEGCAERGVVLLCDETYERFLWGGARHASGAELATEFPETVVVVGSFSKTYAMTGWRVGYALGPRALVAKVIELQSHLTSNPTTFAMDGACAALGGGPDGRGAEADVLAMQTTFAERRELIVERLDRIDGVTCLPPAGAFYAFPQVSSLYRGDIDGSIALAELLLQDAGVAVVPGAAFGADDHVRLSFACSSAEIEEGLDALAKAFDRLRTL